jgi:hypothetical protein
MNKVIEEINELKKRIQKLEEAKNEKTTSYHNDYHSDRDFIV